MEVLGVAHSGKRHYLIINNLYKYFSHIIIFFEHYWHCTKKWKSTNKQTKKLGPGGGEGEIPQRAVGEAMMQ